MHPFYAGDPRPADSEKYSSIYVFFLITSLCIWTAFLHSSQATFSCIHCLYISSSFLSLTSKSLLSHAVLLPPLLNCLCRKSSSKIYQVCSILLYLRPTSQEFSSNNSLNSKKFILLMFKFLKLFFANPTFLKITNSTHAHYSPDCLLISKS